MSRTPKEIGGKRKSPRLGSEGSISYENIMSRESGTENARPEKSQKKSPSNGAVYFPSTTFKKHWLSQQPVLGIARQCGNVALANE